MVLMGAFIFLQVKMETKSRKILDSHQGSSLITSLIADHLKYNRIGNLPTFSSPAQTEVERWFVGKISFPVPLPNFKGPQLLGGRLCAIQGAPLALIFYQQASERISLFIMEGSRIDLTSQEKFHPADRTFLRHKGKTCNALAWKERGLTYVMVSVLPEEQLVDMFIAG